MSFEEQQLSSLNKLLAQVAPENEFYRSKLGEAPSEFASLTEFSSSVPFTTKEELAADHEAHPPYGTTHTFPLENYVRFHQTSGTRGQPMIWLDDESGWDWILQGWSWVWEVSAIRRGDCAFFPFSFGPFLGFWGAYEAATKSGIRVVPGGGMSSEDRVRLLQRSQANVLCCTPTYALRLAQVAGHMGMSADSLGVKKVLVCGEPGGSIPEVRDRIAKAWGATVIDHHGMTEIGPVTVSDPGKPETLLIHEDSYIAEVIDSETGNAIVEGEIGELVLTTLGRAGSPLLRYRTGDLVKPVFDGGRVVALDGGIIGRADDMVVVRGVNIYPSAVEAVVRSVDGVGEYQVEVNQQAALTEICLLVEATAEVADSLKKRFREVFSMRIPVQVVEAGSLPVFEVKAKRWRVVS